ncbi:glycoside hydrolase family 18 protein [Trichoderma cornu-damae]|uniref:chitinase n=1 Tax=Trichoderma cornu-damae TaxID=654480 RepID=A0A9P8QUL8_9HYPO|nr:glycoside hydrolase family 18 protein [Trichoderma cornu-damae]
MQISIVYMALWLAVVSSSYASEAHKAARCIMYLTGQHDVVPSDGYLVDAITHVILAFMRSDVFNAPKTPSEFPLFTTVDKVRRQFKTGTKIMVAIGGWGDSAGFEEAARDDSSRKRWASKVKAMVDLTRADGIDIDWEYPGGNRDDYKLIPNSRRKWEIDAFVLLLRELRSALGAEKLLSIAAPALERDLMAFTNSTVPSIVELVDFISVMTYDMMNRRDSSVKHHSGVTDSWEAVKRYIDRGAPSHKLNLGLGYYAKWFMTEECDSQHPLGCRTQLLEDPTNGADLGKTAAFSWHDEVPVELADSFARAQAQGRYDEDGSYGHWDAEEKRWWSYDTPRTVEIKVPRLLGDLQLGGVFAWGLGEDAPQFMHLKATVDGIRGLRGHQSAVDSTKDEL